MKKKLYILQIFSDFMMGRTTPDTAPNFGYCASQGV